MKAIQLSSHGDADLLQLTEIDTPEINHPTEVKVKLKAASVNPLDTKLRSGAYPLGSFPFVLGCDGAGVIEETGSKVSNLNEGDEVYFFHGGVGTIQGNYAEYIVLDERFVALKPESISFEQAAAAPLILLTAWEALLDRIQLQQGQTIFINAGAGGVGHVAIQLARHLGAQVCTTISSDEKAAFVKELGADHIINYKEQDVTEAIMQWTDGTGVDAVMDNIGADQIQAAFPVVKPYGNVVTLLQPDNSVDWSEARFKNIRFSYEVMLTPLLFGLVDAQAHQTRVLNDCAKLIDDGKLTIHVSDVLPLSQAAEAHKLIESGHTTGKIVLNIE